MAGYLIFHLICLLLGIFALGQTDVILVVSPPLTSSVVGRVLAILHRACLIYNVQEIFPDAFINIGSMDPNSLTARILFRLEKFTYRVSDKITVISDGFAKTLEQKGVPASKLRVIPNFVDVDFMKPSPKDNALARELNLADKFVVVYAGNVGMTQSFDTLLATASELQSEPDIRFLIVGDGVRRAEIARQSAAINNVILLPYQPRSRVPEIYGTADVGLVPLMAGSAKTTLPSKLYSIMSTGRAVLASIDQDLEIVHIVQDAGAGLTVPPDDPSALKKAILTLYRDRSQREHYAKNGRAFALANFSRQAIAAQYNQIIIETASKQVRG